MFMAPSAAIVETSCGKIEGDRVGNVSIFKGIPYGAATGGPNRFRPPVKPDPWTGVREAHAFGKSCWQSLTLPAPGTIAHTIYSEMLAGDKTWEVKSEECLVLNVWTPDSGERGKRPVMVWFHGGFFTAGSGSSRLYDGARLSLGGDVVVVTVNHRLNVFGYLHLADIDPT